MNDVIDNDWPDEYKKQALTSWQFHLHNLPHRVGAYFSPKSFDKITLVNGGSAYMRKVDFNKARSLAR